MIKEEEIIEILDRIVFEKQMWEDKQDEVMKKLIAKAICKAIQREKNDKIIAWAGFADGKICWTWEEGGNGQKLLAIYKYKKEAQDNYEDVRKVQIKTLQGEK